MRCLPVCSAVVMALALTACVETPSTATAGDSATPAATNSAPAPAPTRVTGGPAPVAVVADEAGQATFAGFGDMQLGSTVDEARAAWGGELRGAPAKGSSCHYLLPLWVSDRNELAFMIEEGRFVRYDVGTAKQVAPGGGTVGMDVAALEALYHGALQSTPHKYIEGGRVLSLDASGVAPAKLVFEVDATGKVTAWRVGLAPQVDYVEGCS